MLDLIGGQLAQVAHLIGLCLLVYSLIGAVQCIDRGDLFSGLPKVVLRGVIGAYLMKLSL